MLGATRSLLFLILTGQTVNIIPELETRRIWGYYELVYSTGLYLKFFIVS